MKKYKLTTRRGREFEAEFNDDHYEKAIGNISLCTHICWGVSCVDCHYDEKNCEVFKHGNYVESIEPITERQQGDDIEIGDTVSVEFIVGSIGDDGIYPSNKLNIFRKGNCELIRKAPKLIKKEIEATAEMHERIQEMING